MEARIKSDQKDIEKEKGKKVKLITKIQKVLHLTYS